MNTLDEQKTPAEQDRSAEIAAAALERLVSEGRLTPEEAERYRGTAAPGQPKQTAPVTASPADDLSPMLTPAERLNAHQTIRAAQIIGRISLLFSGLFLALITLRWQAANTGLDDGLLGFLLSMVAVLAATVIFGMTVIPFTAGMIAGLILAKLGRRKMQQSPPDKKAFRRLLIAAFVCEAAGALCAVIGLMKLLHTRPFDS